MKNTNAHELSAMVAKAASVYRLDPEDVAGPRRDVLACAARAEVIADARRRGFSLNFLARYFRRDHSCITNAVRRHHQALKDRHTFKSVRAGR